jgi:hypothetical protein
MIRIGSTNFKYPLEFLGDFRTGVTATPVKGSLGRATGTQVFRVTGP